MDIIDNEFVEGFEKIIQGILVHHGDDFNYYEIEEICQDFLDEIPAKIKNTTKLKRLQKYVTKEFELNGEKKNVGNENFHSLQDNDSTKEYSLENIPKYLFTGKSSVASSLVNIQNLTKHIGLTHLFEGANLKVNKTDKIALIGKNGCGKTTLLKLIIDKISPDAKIEIGDAGKIELAPDLNIGYLSQDLFWESEKNSLSEEMLQVFPEVTKKINRLDELKNEGQTLRSAPTEDTSDVGVNLGVHPDEEIQELNQDLAETEGFRKYELQKNILKYFGFTQEQMEQNVLSLSGGEQTKVQIAKFLIQEVDILILDEPTNHLDIEGIIFLEKFCQTWKKALLIISHDIRFIDNSSERIVEISEKQIHNYVGKYSDYLEQKEAIYQKQLKDFKDQKKELEVLDAYINRFRANSAKAASVQSRIKARDKMTFMSEPVNEKSISFVSINVERRLPEIIMKFSNLEVGYNSPLIILDDEVIVRKAHKIGIIGANGAGKTTLLKTMLGELTPLNGESHINETLKIGSYSQVLEDLDKKSSIINELSKDHGNDKEIRSILGGLLIRGDKVDQQIGSLSGGERAKVGLTKMLLQKPDIIVMDEPTNHLDIHAKEVIKKMLESFNGTTLIVSHDRDLLENVSNTIWLIRDKKLETYDDVEIGIGEVYK